jgi:hypothetical protein
MIKAPSDTEHDITAGPNHQTAVSDRTAQAYIRLHKHRGRFEQKRSGVAGVAA